MEYIYTELMYIGYTLLIILNVQKAYLVPEVNGSALKLFGVVLSITGYLYLMYDKYNSQRMPQEKDKDKEKECHYENKFEPVIGRLLLSIYGFLSFIIPITMRVYLTDIFGISGNMLLINKYDNYHVVAYSLLIIFYSIMSADIFKKEGHEVLRGIAGICFVLNLSKSLLTYYQKYRKNIDKKEKDL